VAPCSAWPFQKFIPEVEQHLMVDYPQYGQALILHQLITTDTPRILVDIGAHDGISGSNSRSLLEQGWRGLLVEPLPAIFAHLRDNSRSLHQVTCVQAACSDRDGTASIYIGKDGGAGQMSSLSRDPSILPNLSEKSVNVPTVTLSTLFAKYAIPKDFGVLLIDTEGWDLTVLRGLESAPSRPRIIVTEDFVSTNPEKYLLLSKLQYRCTGNWGSDSIWVSDLHRIDVNTLRFPVYRLSDSWEPHGVCASPARVMFDDNASPGRTVAGWAWSRVDEAPQENIVIGLRSVGLNHKHFFQAWPTPRPDVAAVFKSTRLLMSGFRAHVDVAAGTYDLTVIQQGDGWYSSDPAGCVSLRTD
jgi:FkbM family methyltransferase